MILLKEVALSAIDEYINYISLQQLQLDDVEATKKKYQEELDEEEWANNLERRAKKGF